MTESPDLMAIMHTLQAEGWRFDLYRVVSGVWRGWWYKPSDARYTRGGDPTGFNAALLKAWRLREYHEGAAR